MIIIKEKISQEKKNSILKTLSISFITISIVLSMATAIMGKKMFDTNIVNQIKTEMVEKYEIKSNEIDYIRKLDYKFYEIVLDDGDVYIFKKDERGKTIMKHIKDKNKELNIDDK